jgi:hypothetical protein
VLNPSKLILNYVVVVLMNSSVKPGECLSRIASASSIIFR